MKPTLLSFVFALFFVFIPESIQAQAGNFGDWQKIELGCCSFFAPPDLTSIPVQGTDSAIWQYQSDSLIINIDLGLYSGKSDIYQDELEYSEKKVKVDKKNATLVRFKYRESNAEGFDYETAIYFPRVGDKYTKLSFVVNSKTSEQQNLAEKILLSIKFN